RSHVQTRAGVGAALSVGEPGHAGVLPLARAPRPSRLRGGDRLRHPPRHDPRAPGTVRGGADPQDRDPLAPPRLYLRGVRGSRLGPGRRPGGLMISATTRPRLASKARLRFDRKSTRYMRSEEHTSELQSPDHLVCRLLLEKKNDELKG